MASDINANIGVSINTSDALAQLKNLQRRIAEFHSSVAKSSTTAAVAQRDLQQNFLNSVNAIQGFSAELRTVRTTAETFTNSLEKNKFSIREYFNYAAGATGKFGQRFSAELNTIEKTAVERVKTLQTQYIKMGRDASGAMQAIAVRPTVLNMQDLGTQTAIAAQKQAIFNQLVKQGSTQLLNFGKNTQWAGRQLMVGFTLPLASLGMVAGKTFMQMEEQAIKFRKVYGDLFTSPQDTEKAFDDIIKLAGGFTKYGVAVSDTIGLASEAAAAGFAGVDLQNQTTAATRLSILGQLEQNKALETTIALQNAFAISSQDLAANIDFLNAVENQTVVSLDDITTAVPKVAPVIQQLGGDVKDLAFFLAAMKEGGVNASEGANALKSGLASLINPTKQASDMLAGFGINIQNIVNTNQGDLKGTVIGVAQALDRLDPLSRAQAIEQLFGKFQFARMSALFSNVIKDSTQAARVLDLANASTAELAALSEKELGQSAASAMNKFRKAVEDLKVALVPLGQLFLEIATPFIDFAKTVLDAFNNLPDGIKKAMGTVIGVVGGLGPVLLMTFGLINNGIANMIKFFATVRLGYLKITGKAQGIGQETQYMTTEQLEAAAAAASLDQAHSNLTQRFTAETAAVLQLKTAYEQAVAAGNRFALLNPGMMRPGTPQKFAAGGFVQGPGTGRSDSIPALVSNGEAIIPAAMAKKYAPLVNAIISGNIPGFSKGKKSETTSLYGGSTVMISGAGVPYAPGNTAGSRLGMSQDFFRSEDFSKMFTAGAIGSTFKAQAAKNETMDLSKLTPYLDEAEADLKIIANILQESERSLELSGKNISSFEDITANARKELEKKFSEMTARGGRAANVAKTVKDEMLFPTKESIQASSLSETRARAVKVNPSGKITETAYRVGSQSTRGQKGAIRAAELLYPNEAESLKLRGGSYAHLNEKRLGGPSVPYAGGVMAMSDSAAKQAAIERLNTASKAQAAKYPEGQLITRTQAKSQGKEAGTAFNEGVKETAKDTFINSRDRNSPHKQAAKDGRDDGKAYGEAFVQENEKTKTKRGPRRVTTSGPTPVGNTPLLSIKDPKSGNIFNQEKYDKQQASRAEAANRLSRIQTAQTQALVSNFSSVNARLMQFSFGLSALGGIATMFGGQIGEFGNAIFSVTSAIFALSTITELLVKTKMGELALSKISAAAGARSASIVGAMGAGQGLPAATKISELFTRGGGLVGLFKNLGTGISFVLRFLGPIGIAFSLLAIAVPFIANVMQEQKNKIEGLGAAANLSAEKLNSLAQRFNVTAKTIDWSSRAKIPAGGQQTSAQRQTSEDLLNDPEFEKEFALEISGIKNATLEQGQLALESLAMQLRNSGFEDEAVTAIITAIATKAGQKDLNLNFKAINISSAATANAAADLAAQAVAGFNEEFSRAPLNDFLAGIAQDLDLDVTLGAAGVAKSSIDSLTIAFENGSISADVYNKAISSLFTSLQSAERPTWMLQGLAKQMGLEETVSGLTDAKDMAMILQAVLAGIELPNEEEMKVLKAANADPKNEALQTKANKIRKRYSDLTVQAIENQEKLNKEIQNEDTIEAQQASITEMRDKISVYRDLVKGGTDASIAYKIAGDAALLAAYKQAQVTDAMNGNTIAVDNFVASVAELDKLTAEFEGLNPAGGGGGAGQKSPFQEAIDKLKEQRKEIKESLSAYSKLRKAGMNVGDAFAAAQDPILAAAIATTKVGTAAWEKLIKAIRQTNKELAKSQILELLREQRTELVLQKQFASIVPILNTIGLELSDIQDILSNPALAKAFIKDLKDGALESKKLKTYLEQIAALKQIEINIQLSTEEGLQDKFDEMYGMAMEMFDIQEAQIEDNFEDVITGIQKNIEAVQKEIEGLQTTIESKQRDIEINITRPIEAFQEQISDLQREMEMQFDRPIADLQLESTDLANDLTVMNKAADEINKKYDEQGKALEKVSKINQDIINQQKSQMNLADALASGDIASAAEAVQEMRSQNAAANAASAQDILDANRQAEIEGLRSASGMTKDEIEKRQFEISQQIYKLEKERRDVQKQIQTIQDKIYDLEEQREAKLIEIRDIEDDLYELQNGRLQQLEDELERQEDLKQAQIDLINKQREAWNDAKLAADQAKIAGEKYKNVIEMTKFLMEGVKKTWDEIKSKIITLEVRTVNLPPEISPPSNSTPPTGNPGTGNPGSGGNKPNPAYAAAQKAVNDLVVELNRVTAKKDKLVKERNDLEKLGAAVRIITGQEGRYQQLKNTLVPQWLETVRWTGKALQDARTKLASTPQYLAKGGIVKPKGTDTAPAMLTPGEFVVNRSAAKKFMPLLLAINSAIGSTDFSMLEEKFKNSKLRDFRIPKNFNEKVYTLPVRDYPGSQVSGGVFSSASSQNTTANLENSVYNYNLSVNVNGSNSSANEIANVVMNKLRNVKMQNVRGQVIR